MYTNYSNLNPFSLHSHPFELDTKTTWNTKLREIGHLEACTVSLESWAEENSQSLCQTPNMFCAPGPLARFLFDILNKIWKPLSHYCQWVLSVLPPKTTANDGWISAKSRKLLDCAWKRGILGQIVPVSLKCIIKTAIQTFWWNKLWNFTD